MLRLIEHSEFFMFVTNNYSNIFYFGVMANGPFLIFYACNATAQKSKWDWSVKIFWCWLHLNRCEKLAWMTSIVEKVVTSKRIIKMTIKTHQQIIICVFQVQLKQEELKKTPCYHSEVKKFHGRQ